MKSRNTIQRALILEAARQLDHPTADDVCRLIARTHPTVSRGTVYRNLNLLVTQGILLKIAVPDAADRFDVTVADHYHIHCRICGKAADVDLPYQAELIQRVADSHGYLVEDHDIVLRGICPDCLARAENQEKTAGGTSGDV